MRLYKPIRFKIIKNILGIGIPTAGENVAWNVGQLLVMSMVNKMGIASITASNLSYAYFHSDYDIFHCSGTWVCNSCGTACGGSRI